MGGEKSTVISLASRQTSENIKFLRMTLCSTGNQAYSVSEMYPSLRQLRYYVLLFAVDEHWSDQVSIHEKCGVFGKMRCLLNAHYTNIFGVSFIVLPGLIDSFIHTFMHLFICFIHSVCWSLVGQLVCRFVRKMDGWMDG